MKKLSIAVLTLALILACASIGVFADSSADGFTYNGSKITGYTGNDADIEIPATLNGQKITTIGANAFKNKSVVSVEVAKGITTIESGAFSGSALILITLPSTLTTVGDSAFSGCSNLQAIEFQSVTCSLGKNALSGTSDELNVFIPLNSSTFAWSTAIKTAKGDSNFTINYSESTDTDTTDNTTEVTLPFTDVAKTSWYYNDVASAYNYGIINGVTTTTFAPDKNMTRAEAVKIAAMIFSINYDSTKETANALLELSKESAVWYEPYVAYGIEEGFIPLESDFVSSGFDWTKNATRAEMAFLFANADVNQTIINNVTYSIIPDVDQNTKYGEQILALYQRGVAQGSDSKHTYNPDTNVKRSEVAAFITRLMDPDARKTI